MLSQKQTIFEKRYLFLNSMIRTVSFCLILLLLTVQAGFAKPILESPSIADKESLIYFVRDCIEARLDEFIINYSHGFMGNNDDLLYACNIPHIYSKLLENKNKSSRVLYRITYYPGMRVSDAYITNNQTKLTSEQRRLYRIAVNIIKQAQNMTDLEAELYFHDIICKNVTYFSNTSERIMPRHATALGVFLDHKANCQGYCDAFYMLCTMRGLKVDMQSGMAANQRHVWNVIEIDKKWYAVDVTWDDNESRKNRGYEFISHKYFNASREILRITHSWNEEDETEEIEDLIDAKYFYTVPQLQHPDFGVFLTDPNEIFSFITKEVQNKKNKIQIMTLRYEKRLDDLNFVNFQIDRILKNAGKRMSFFTISQKHGNYLYLSIDLKEYRPRYFPKNKTQRFHELLSE